MVQHSNWYISVPPGHGTTFELVCRCTTRTWYNIQTGTLVYHPSMVQHSKLVRQCTTQPWYNIRTGTSVYHPAMVQHSNWYVGVPPSMVQHSNWCVGVPPSHGTTFELVRWCTTRPWYNIQTGTSVYHPAMVQHSNWYIGVPPCHGTTFDLVHRCTTRPWYNI